LDSDNSGDDKDKAIDRKRFKNKEHFTTQKKVIFIINLKNN